MNKKVCRHQSAEWNPYGKWCPNCGAIYFLTTREWRKPHYSGAVTPGYGGKTWK
jgi:hypothetical protein